MIRTTLITALAAAALAASAGGAWLVGAGTALAPEPARLTQGLGTTSGASAAAYFLNTNFETTVVKWPGTWMPNTSLPAGKPCSTVSLAAGVDATQSIQVHGNYRKCV